MSGGLASEVLFLFCLLSVRLTISSQETLEDRVRCDKGPIGAILKSRALEVPCGGISQGNLVDPHLSGSPCGPGPVLSTFQSLHSQSSWWRYEVYKRGNQGR